MDTLCKIRDIQRAVARFEAEFEKKYGICMNEGMVLCSLKNAPRLSSGQLCELLGLTPSNTSKVIKSVEQKGLIERVLGEADKRQMYFSLSPKGKHFVQEFHCQSIRIPAELSPLLDRPAPATDTEKKSMPVSYPK